MVKKKKVRTKSVTKEEFDELVKAILRERKRIDRVVQVLLHNLPEEKLDKYVDFTETDWCGREYYRDYMTLRSFLRNVIDP